LLSSRATPIFGSVNDQEILIAAVTEALEAAAEPGFRERQQGYFKEEIKSMGVRVSAVRAVAKQLFPVVKPYAFPEFLDACEALLKVGIDEYRTVAFVWAFTRRKELTPAHYDVLYHWLNTYVSNWAGCDQLCSEVFGDFMLRYPQLLDKNKEWVRSENRWLKRAAAVIMIPMLRKKQQRLELAFEIAETLFDDRDDLVQKGYGWMLKEATETELKPQVITFIMAHKAKMSRTSLRYAIEKLNPEEKAVALKA
jgi:3-methyladenine DNA glycosylase AlkD